MLTKEEVEYYKSLEDELKKIVDSYLNSLSRKTDVNKNRRMQPATENRGAASR